MPQDYLQHADSVVVNNQVPCGLSAGLCTGSGNSYTLRRISRRQILLVNVVVGLLGSDGILKSICLSGSIIVEDATAENQSRAILSLFTESAQLLANWIKTTAEKFPDPDDLLDLISKPSSMCVPKPLKGVVSTDTCNTTQLTHSMVIEHIYRICREKACLRVI